MTVKMSDDYYTKPTMWCLLIHRTDWIDQADYGCNDVMHCPKCSVYFDYPTQQSIYPVYKK